MLRCSFFSHCSIIACGKSMFLQSSSVSVALTVCLLEREHYHCTVPPPRQFNLVPARYWTLCPTMVAMLPHKNTRTSLLRPAVSPASWRTQAQAGMQPDIPVNWRPPSDAAASSRGEPELWRTTFTCSAGCAEWAFSEMPRICCSSSQCGRTKFWETFLCYWNRWFASAW